LFNPKFQQMAKADNNLIINHLSGTIGDQITIRQSGGSTIVSKKQKKKKTKGTEKQLNAQQHFRRASKVAKALLLDPDIYALYKAAAGPGLTAYNLAFADAYTPPEIKAVTVSVDKIMVLATDDFRVYGVTVSIYNATGGLIEQGPAIAARNGKDWAYTITSDNKGLKGALIKVMAEDIPGNKTYSEISY
jgi:hypothetical protein